VTERAITMGPVEVRAILEGAKSQLRREYHWHPGRGAAPCPCPPSKIGDRLWVREAFEPQFEGRGCATPDADLAILEDGERVYRAGGVHRGSTLWPGSRVKRRSPQHMPRWASRLTLEVIAVRFERLTAITEADAIAEGMHSVPGGHRPTWSSLRPHPNIIDPVMGHEHCLGSAIHAFGNAWIARTRDADAWSRDRPVWVQVIEFAVERRI